MGAVYVNEKLIGIDQKPLQVELEKQLEIFKDELSKYPIFNMRKQSHGINCYNIPHFSVVKALKEEQERMNTFSTKTLQEVATEDMLPSSDTISPKTSASRLRLCIYLN